MEGRAAKARKVRGSWGIIRSRESKVSFDWGSLLFPLGLITAGLAFVAWWEVAQIGTDCSLAAEALARSDSYRAWAVAVGIGLAVGLLLAIPLCRRIGTVWRRANPVVAILTGLVVLAVTTVPSFYSRRVLSSPLYGDNATFCNLSNRTLAVLIAFALLILPGYVLIDMVRQAARSHETDSIFFVRRNRELRNHLQTATSSLAAIFTVALLGVALLRSAIIDAGGEFGEMRLVMFGLQYSTILLVLYFAAATALDNQVATELEHHYPFPPIDSDDFAKVADERDRITKALGASDSPTSRIQSQAPIAAPLLISIITAAITG